MPENKTITFSDNDIFDDTKIEVVGGKAQLILNGSYPTDSPTIQTATAFNFKDTLDFIENATKPLGTDLGYVFQDGDILKWFDGSNVSVSDGTYAQSNTVEEIQTNKHLFVFENTVSLIVFLNSDGSATPVI